MASRERVLGDCLGKPCGTCGGGCVLHHDEVDVSWVAVFVRICGVVRLRSVHFVMCKFDLKKKHTINKF